MKLLNEIKLEIARREKEINSLIDAANLIASLESGRGRKVKITSKIASLIDNTGKSKPKKDGRGRPKGSTNKPGAKKTGPRKSAVVASSEASVDSSAPKVLKKRGRKPGATKAKTVKASRVPKAAKVEKA